MRGADVIVTATTADAPLVRLDWVKPGAYIASMGSYQELEDSVVLEATKIVVDSWEQTAHRGELRRLVEAGRLQRHHVHAEMRVASYERRLGASDHHVLGSVGLGSLTSPSRASSWKSPRAGLDAHRFHREYGRRHPGVSGNQHRHRVYYSEGGIPECARVQLYGEDSQWGGVTVRGFSRPPLRD